MNIMQTSRGATPLMYACQQCRERDVLEILSKQPLSVKDVDRTSKTPLHYCAENATTNCAEIILKAAPELVNAQDENGYCTLHLAVISGNKALIKLLITRGANINIYDNEGHSAVHWAIVSSEKEALEMIIRAGADASTPDIHGGYPLHYAVQMCGSNSDTVKSPADAVKAVQTLLRFGVNVNVNDKDGRQPILWAASAGCSADAVIHLISGGACVDAADKDGLTALHCAASRGHTSTIETLVKLCGSNVDVIDGNGCSALFYAVTLGHADSTQVLLHLGAEPNRQDRKGRTPAHCGAAKGQLETLKILQKHGGNLWLRNVKGDLPLHDAVASGRKDLVLWLLSQNSEAINTSNNDGRCPLHIAAMCNNTEMIKVLLDARSLVNPVMRTSKGVLMTPLNVALCKGHRSCGKFLQLHGGVPFSKVSKVETNLVYAVRISPTDDTMTKTGEATIVNITPTYSKTSKTNTGSDAQVVKTDATEKKKVYRRRKKRKNLSTEKKVAASRDSESEDSLYDFKIRPQERCKRGSSNEIDEGNEKKITVEKVEKIEKVVFSKTDDTISSRAEKESKESEAEIKKEAKSKVSENNNKSKPLLRTISFNEHKNVSSLSPDDFPPLMQNIGHIDAEMIDTEIDVHRVLSENENEFNSIPVQKVEENVTTTEKKQEEKVDEKDSKESGENKTKFTELDINSGEVATSSDVQEQKVQSKEGGISQTKKEQIVEEVFIKEEVKKNEEDVKIDENKKSAEIVESVTSSTTVPIESISGTVQVTVQEPNEEDDKLLKVLVSGVQENVAQVLENVGKGDMKKDENQTTQVELGETDEKIQKLSNEITELATGSIGEPTEQNGDKKVLIASTKIYTEPKNEGPEESFSFQVIQNVGRTEEAPGKINSDNQTAFESIENPPVIFTNDIIEPTKDAKQEKEDSDALFVQPEDNNNGEINKPEVIPSDDQPEERESAETENITTDHLESKNVELPKSEIEPEDGVNKHSSELNRVDKEDGSDNDNGNGKDNENHVKIKKGESDSDVETDSLYEDKNDEKENSLAHLHGEENPSIRKSPRIYKAEENGWIAGEHRHHRTPRISRLCRKSKESKDDLHQISVTQLVQNTIRKYHVERGIFHQLLELKRLQIRAGRANEQVLVKRLVDEYERSRVYVGMKHYTGAFKFREFEKFLYDQLKILNNRTQVLVPEMRSYDDIDALSGILKKSRLRIFSEVPPTDRICTCITQRCHHTTHAYTNVPCSAYVGDLRRQRVSKPRRNCFLPKIKQLPTYKSEDRQKSGLLQPTTLELIQGNEKQVISLPRQYPDKGKKYYVTFTIKSASDYKDEEDGDNFFDDSKHFFKHRHAKTV